MHQLLLKIQETNACIVLNGKALNTLSYVHNGLGTFQLYTRIRKGTLILIAGIVTLISSFVVPWDMFLPPFRVEQKWEWQISPNVVGVSPLDLIWGTRIHGTIYCSGANNDIGFHIADSADRVIFNPGRIYSSYKFRWQAPYNDIYHLKFDNTISWFATKIVGYWIELYYYFHILLLVGIITIIVGVYFIVERGNRKDDGEKDNPLQTLCARRTCIFPFHLSHSFLTPRNVNAKTKKGNLRVLTMFVFSKRCMDIDANSKSNL